MKLVKPDVSFEDNIDGNKILKYIEKIGRTCYKSENKITDDSAQTFMKNILSRKHESVIEHYAISVRFIVDRGITHELVRHRIASFSQESTRYVNYSKKGIEFILPCWFKTLTTLGEYNYYLKGDNDSFEGPGRINFSEVDDAERLWFLNMLSCERKYNELIKKGWRPQQARSVLPNSLKTELVMTANLREFRHIFKLRTSKVAHPQMVEIMTILLSKFREKIPVVFDDI